LSIAIEARGKKISRAVVPEANAGEAAMVSGVEVYPVKSLLEVIHFIDTGNGIHPLQNDSSPSRSGPCCNQDQRRRRMTGY
jgi:magnesium chelatase family protein